MGHRQPLTLIATYRPGDVAGLEWLRDGLEQSGGSAVAVVRLSSFTDGEAREVLSGFSGGIAGDTEVGRRVIERAKGNPLFIRELAALYREPGLELTTVPPTIHRVVQRRLDAMPRDLQHATTAAAVLGVEVDPRLLAAVLERAYPGTDAESVLKRLGASGVFTAGGPGIGGNLEFTHAVIQEAVYSTLKRDRLEELHRAAGGAMEAIYPDNLDAWVPQLAFHWAATKDDKKAVHYLEAAGDRARGVFDLDAATALYGQAMARVDESSNPNRARQLHLKLATCHGIDLRFADEREAYRHAFALPEPPTTPAPRDGCLRIGLDFQYSRFGLHPICDRDFYCGSAIHRQVYRPLVRVSTELTPVPDAAESWEVSEDGRHYEFRIRPGISWSDGAPMVADDFIAAVERRGVGPEYRGPTRFVEEHGRQGWKREKGAHNRWRIRATAPDLVEIELRYPYPYLFRALCSSDLSSLPAHLLNRLGTDWRDVGQYAFSGPFMVTSIDGDGSVTLGANPGYGGQFPGNVGRVEYLNSPGENGIEPYMDGSVDILPNLTVRNVQQALERCPEDLVGVPGQSRGAVLFWSGNEILRTLEVRQAFALAIDRERLCGDLLGGFARPAGGGNILPGVQGHSPSGGLWYDPERARELAVRAIGNDALRSAKFTVSVNERTADEAQFIASNWERVLGVSLDIEVLDRLAFTLRVTGPHPPDISIAHLGETAMDPLESLGNVTVGPTGWTRGGGADLIPTALARVPDGAEAYLAAIRELDLRAVHDAWKVPYCYSLNYRLQRKWIRKLRWVPAGLMGLEEVVVLDH